MAASKEVLDAAQAIKRSARNLADPSKGRGLMQSFRKMLSISRQKKQKTSISKDKK